MQNLVAVKWTKFAALYATWWFCSFRFWFLKSLRKQIQNVSIRCLYQLVVYSDLKGCTKAAMKQVTRF